MAVLTVVGMFLLRPGHTPDADLTQIGISGQVVRSTVLGVDLAPCEGTEPEQRILCRFVGAEVLDGPDAGSTVRFSLADAPTTPDLRPGDAIVLNYEPRAEEGFRYSYADRERRPILLGLALLFALFVVLLGRLRGLAALAGLAASIGVLLTFVLPAVLGGRSPLLVAVVGASAIAFLALYLAHGFTTMTTVALLGTLASLALTAVLSEVFVGLARISGFASEEAVIVSIGAAELDIAGLILGGVVIGALGAIDDMTVTQASAVWELHTANPRLGPAGLLRSGLRVGRDHVASTVNTLVLAYAGASMPLLVLFVLADLPLGTVANTETVATEILRTLVGSIGLVASVPITTWLAARTVGSARMEGEAETRTDVHPGSQI
jgi:uncharacterized membrane protein